MAQVTGFHHIALRAADFDRSYKFYTQVIGLKEIAAWGERPGRAAMLKLPEGGSVELFEGGAGEAPDLKAAAGVFFHLALSAPSADAAYENALAAGAPSVIAPKDVVLAGDPPIKARIAFVAGPDGEQVEFFEEK